MSTAEIAYLAAEILSERGLAKFAFEDENGAVCFWGAISAADPAASWTGGEGEISTTARHILQERGYDGDTMTWNDLPQTSKEDVILLLKETGHRLECG
jgi:hypothetical protein